MKRVESVRSMTSGSAPAGHQTSTHFPRFLLNSAAEKCRGIASHATGTKEGAGEAHHDHER